MTLEETIPYWDDVDWRDIEKCPKIVKVRSDQKRSMTLVNTSPKVRNCFDSGIDSSYWRSEVFENNSDINAKKFKATYEPAQGDQNLIVLVRQRE